jgi:hypothetical protein
MASGYNDATERCRIGSAARLEGLIDSLLESVGRLSQDGISSEGQTVSPFAAYLLYRTAVVLTKRAQCDIEPEQSLTRLRGLRKYLRLMGQRWQAAGEQTGFSSFSFGSAILMVCRAVPSTIERRNYAEDAKDHRDLRERYFPFGFTGCKSIHIPRAFPDGRKSFRPSIHPITKARTPLIASSPSSAYAQPTSSQHHKPP